MALLKIPTPLPLTITLSEVVGSLLVELQHTPRAVTAVNPWLATEPPELASLLVMEVTLAVVTVGNCAIPLWYMHKHKMKKERQYLNWGDADKKCIRDIVLRRLKLSYYFEINKLNIIFIAGW
jgi:hypothetical protein